MERRPEDLESNRQKRIEACANYLGIAATKIDEVTIKIDGGGHFTGLQVEIFIPTGRRVQEWMDRHAAEDESISSSNL